MSSFFFLFYCKFYEIRIVGFIPICGFVLITLYTTQSTHLTFLLISQIATYSALTKKILWQKQIYDGFWPINSSFCFIDCLLTFLQLERFCVFLNYDMNATRLRNIFQLGEMGKLGLSDLEGKLKQFLSQILTLWIS